MKMLLPDVIGHENQSQHCPDHRCLCLVLSGRITTPDGFSYHTGAYSVRVELRKDYDSDGSENAFILGIFGH